ncbi:M20/M25/M40 family metallo-hydrolase [Peterkaempfera sp. SMS 1(5)a]|uniref:M20/M25/M40 family metallo-hydrolase n=1 Tax=Peterkaempfera podocarpi TaxID=3232308 RepID=UPI00366A8F31
MTDPEPEEPDGLCARLPAAARARERRMRRRLAQLVALESPSGDALRLDLLAGELTRGLAAAGAQVERIPGAHGDHLVARLDGRTDGGHLLVLAHHDTVWPAGSTAELPYREHRDGTATGAGVFDMKGSLVVLETALALLGELGACCARPVVALVLSDEEVGSPDGGRLVARHLPGAAAALGLEPPHPDGGLKTARRGSARIRLEVTGRESHAGLEAARGVSAIDELTDQLLELRGRIGARPGNAVNVGRISGGTRANVVAGRAEAELGLRFTEAAAEREALRLLATLPPHRAGARIHAEVLSRRPAWQPGSDRALMDHARALGARLGLNLTGGPAGGAGDTNWPGAAGVPTLDGLGPQGGGAHARSEHIRLDALAPRPLCWRPCSPPRRPQAEQRRPALRTATRRGGAPSGGRARTGPHGCGRTPVRCPAPGARAVTDRSPARRPVRRARDAVCGRPGAAGGGMWWAEWVVRCSLRANIADEALPRATPGGVLWHQTLPPEVP